MPVIDLLQFSPHDTSWMIVADEIDNSSYEHYITNMRTVLILVMYCNWSYKLLSVDPIFMLNLAGRQAA